MSIAPFDEQHARAVERMREFASLVARVEELSSEALRFTERGETAFAAIVLQRLMEPLEKLIDDRARLVTFLRAARSSQGSQSAG